MDILKGKSIASGKPEEIRVKSTGKCSVIVEVFDEMLEAMFKDFPGNSSDSKTVVINDAKFDC